MSEPHRPLHVFCTTLTTVDALAYERLPRELAGREKAALFALPFLADVVAASLPVTWPVTWRWTLAAMATLAVGGLVLLACDGRRRRRARRFAEREGEVRVEDWGDHLAVRSRSRIQFVALETIAQVIADKGHVFLRHQDGPTILPLRVFEDAADMQAYAAVLEKRCREAAA